MLPYASVQNLYVGKKTVEAHTKLRYVVELVKAMRRRKHIRMPGNSFERLAFDAKLVGHVFCTDLRKLGRP